jgi:hypothetical protein
MPQPLTYSNIAVALVDPPLRNPFKFCWDDLRNGEWFGHPAHGVHSWTPYGGGYVDFARLGEECEYLSCYPHRGHGLREDLETCLRGNYSVFLSHAQPIDLISQLLQKNYPVKLDAYNRGTRARFQFLQTGHSRKGLNGC